MTTHCGTCSCGTVEYGVTFQDGARKGEQIGPLPTESICYWNRNTPIWIGVRLLIRIRPEQKWRLATDDEVTHWNTEIMAPHVLRRTP